MSSKSPRLTAKEIVKQLKNANAICKYLNSIENTFSDWMLDPARGGMAKSFFMSGMQAGLI